MSMNFSEFRKLIIADPWSQEPELVLARKSDPPNSKQPPLMLRPWIRKATTRVPAEEVERIMASLNASAGQSLTGMVKLIKYCPTPLGRGAHLVVSTADGPMTIVFMPRTKVRDGEMLEFDHKHAYMVNLEHGSAAIIGRSEQPVSGLQALVRSSITSSQAET